MNLKGLCSREKNLKCYVFIVLPCIIFLSLSYRNPSSSHLHTRLFFFFFCFKHVIKRSQTSDVHWYLIHVKQQERWQATPVANGQIKHAWLNSYEINAARDMNIQGMNDNMQHELPSPEYFMKQKHKLFPVLWNPHTFNSVPQSPTKMVIKEVLLYLNFCLFIPSDTLRPFNKS